MQRADCIGDRICLRVAQDCFDRTYTLKSFASILCACVFLFLPVVAKSEADTLAQARLFMEQGRFQQALKAASAIEALHPVDAALIQARSYMGTGQSQSAIEAAQRALSLDPQRFDAHYLLALALETAGQSLRAELQYRRAFDVSSSEVERALTLEAIHRLEGAKDWKVSVNLGLAPSSNVNKATSNETVTLISGPSPIHRDPPYSGVGLAYNLNLSETDKSGLSFGIRGQIYEDPSLANTVVSVGYNTFVAAELPTKVSFERQFHGEDFYRDRLSANVEMSGPIDASLTVAAVNYAKGDQVTEVFGSFDRTLFSFGRVEVGGQLRLERKLSDSPEYAAAGAGMTLIAGWQAGQTGFKASLGYNARQWDDVYWQYPQPRSDRDALASLEISPQAVSIFGLYPVVQGSWLRRQSNIATYEVESFDFYTGLAASF